MIPSRPRVCGGIANILNAVFVDDKHDAVCNARDQRRRLDDAKVTVKREMRCRITNSSPLMRTCAMLQLRTDDTRDDEQTTSTSTPVHKYNIRVRSFTIG